MTNLGALIDVLDKGQKFLLISHINPDGDTLGSALALKYAIENKGRFADVICDGEVPNNLKVLYGSDSVNNLRFNLSEYDTFGAIDCGDTTRLGSYAYIFDNNKKQTFAIDHHLGHKPFTKLDIVDSTLSATAELVYDLICAWDKSVIDDAIASLLYIATVTDSGIFSYNSVKSHTHAMAAELIKFNFNASDLVYNVFKKVSFPVFKLQSEALDKARFYENNKIAIAVFTRELFAKYNQDISSTEGAVNKLLNIDSVFFAMTVTEISGNCYKVSIRSKDPYSAANCAQKFGGGGHKNAAGLRINGNIFDVLDKLVANAKDELEV